MKLLPEQKPNGYDLVVVLLVLVLAAGLGLRTWTSGAQSGALYVEVEIDGQPTDRFLLGDTGQRTYSNRGYTLTLQPCEDGICVLQSDCPTQDCVRTGTIMRVGESIVCLPARIVVTLVGTSAQYDVIAG